MASSVTAERRLRILADLTTNHPRIDTPALCEVGRRVTGVTGTGIILFSGDVPIGSACTANDLSALIEDLQYSLGEGPCVDAHRTGQPVLEPDLADPAQARWLAFSGPAVEAGVRAVFGFPMAVGAARVGALNLYVDRPGGLSADQHADALAMAEVAAESVLAMQDDGVGGALAAELEAGANLHSVVHQAAGMASAQLEVSVAEALARLRAHAFVAGRPLDEVAADVVARRLRMDGRLD